MPTPTAALPTDQAHLAAAFRLLGQLWLQEVDRNTLAVLQNPAVTDALLAMGLQIPLDNTPDTIDALAADYCQLLIGPKGHLPPVQSVWSEHIFQGKAAASANRFHEVFPDFEPGSSIIDHLGVQMRFVAHALTYSPDATTAAEVTQQFHAKHLQWPEPLLTRVAQRAKTDFYRSLPAVTRQLLSQPPQFGDV